MNDLTWKYVAFVVAVSILIWAVMQLNQRLQRHKKTDSGTLNTWIRLDPSNQNTDVSPDGESDDQEETPEPDMHVRAKQNGHYSRSKKSR